jgi:hypothetical protein
MPLSVGDKLRRNEIVAPLRKGDIGEVYRAHNTRLNRDATIKVSKEQLTVE